MVSNIIRVCVSWTGDNFCAVWDGGAAGVVAVTAKTLEGLKEDFPQSLRWHIEGCVSDGDILPEYLVEGNYSIDYNLDAAALLRNAEVFTTMAAISRASGINQKQLSHYANGLKKPRDAQRQRIIDGLRRISAQIMALC